MSVVTVLYGPAYDGKNEEAFNTCLKKIQRQESDSWVYLVRTDVRVRQLRERLFKELSGCFHCPIWTLPDFLKYLYREIPGRKRILGELEQNIFIEDILREHEKEWGGGYYFQHFREHPGILLKITEFLTAIRRVGIDSVEELQEKFHSCRGRQAVVYEELLKLYTFYTRRLEEAHVIDDTGIFLELARVAEAGQLDIHQWIPSPELLVLEGYYELTPPEQQILTAFCAQFEQSILTLDLPINPYNFPSKKDIAKPFHLFKDLVQYIQRAGFSVREFPRSPSTLKGGLGVTPRSIVSRPAESVSLKAYHNRKEEVIHIAREIRTLYREGNISELREIGVAFPVIEQYTDLIQEIFPLYGIPFTMFRGYALASSPVVVTLFLLFQVVSENFSRESLRRLFSSPLFQIHVNNIPPEGSSDSPPLILESRTYHYLDSLASEVGIIGGKQEWGEKLAQYKQQLEEGINSERQKGDEQSLPVGYFLISALQNLLEFLSHFEENIRYCVTEYIQFIKDSIRQFHIAQGIFQTTDQAIREKDSSALRTFLKVLETLQQELSNSSPRNPYYSEFTLREFVDLLRTAVQNESYYLPQRLDDSVFIMGRLDTRQVQFRYLFFGGLVEKDFPGQDEPNIFLSEQDAEILGLPTYTNKLQEASHLFYLNTLNPEVKLYLSYPLQEDEKDLLRSTYIDRLLNELEEEKSETLSAQPNESQNDLETVYTYTELYQWLGRKLGQHGSAPMYDTVLHYIQEQKGPQSRKNFLSAITAHMLRNREELSSFDGLLSSEWTKNVLEKLYRRHIYSVSEFDLYIRCPIKFFLRRILRLEPLPKILPEFTAIDIGNLLHKIVYRFYADIPADQKNSTLGELSQNFLQGKGDRSHWLFEAQQRIAAIAWEELALYDFSGAFWDTFTHTLLAGLSSVHATPQSISSTSGQQGILAKFVGLEALDQDKVLPRYLEAHFGMSDFLDTLSHEETQMSGYQLSAAPYTIHGTDRTGRSRTVRIQGKIDRIDLEPLSEIPSSETSLKAVIYDYKTGGVSSVQQIKDGRSFQLPLYLLAVRDLLGDSAEVIAAGYYMMRSPQDIGKKSHLGSKEHSEQRYFKGYSRTLYDSYEDVLSLLDNYANRAIQVSQDIRTGRFHPTRLGAKDAGCDYCEYCQICRVDHQRMSKISLE